MQGARAREAALWPRVEHRACPVKRFPFRIVYRVVEGSVLVVAIAHAKRRPGYWKNRA